MNNKNEQVFAWIGLGLCLAFLVLEFINGRNQFYDFQVYYGAACDFLAGQDPYVNYYGVSSGYYKYSPVVLLPFSLLALLPYTLASVIFYLIISVSSLALMVQMKRFLSPYFNLQSPWVFVPLWMIMVLLITHWVRELHLGNVNLLLLCLFTWAFFSIRNGKEILAGFLIAFGLLVKPHFLVLLPLFVLRSQWKLLGSTMVSMALLAGLPLLFYGWSGNITLHNSWFQTMVQHNDSLVNSPNTIYGLLNKLFQSFGTSAGDSLIVIVLGLVAAGVFVLVLYNRYRLKERAADLRFFLEYFLLIALIPSITHTDTEHFLWTMPILALLIFLALQKTSSTRRWIFLALLLLATIPWTLNSPDIVGKSTAIAFEKGGWIGLSNLIIIGSCLFFYFLKDSKTIS